MFSSGVFPPTSSPAPLYLLPGIFPNPSLFPWLSQPHFHGQDTTENMLYFFPGKYLIFIRGKKKKKKDDQTTIPPCPQKHREGPRPPCSLPSAVVLGCPAKPPPCPMNPVPGVPNAPGPPCPSAAPAPSPLLCILFFFFFFCCQTIQYPNYNTSAGCKISRHPAVLRSRGQRQRGLILSLLRGPAPAHRGCSAHRGGKGKGLRAKKAGASTDTPWSHTLQELGSGGPCRMGAPGAPCAFQGAKPGGQDPPESQLKEAGPSGEPNWKRQAAERGL